MKTFLYEICDSVDRSKGKVVFCIIKRNSLKMCGGIEVYLYTFFALSIDGGE